MAEPGRRRLHRHPLREGDGGHRCDHAHQGGHRGGDLRQLSGGLEDQGPGEEVFRLCALAHQDGRGASGTLRDRGDRRRGQPQVRLPDGDGERDHQQHGAHLAAQQERSHRRRLHRFLQREEPRPEGPLCPGAHQRRGRGKLQGHAVHPRGGKRGRLHRRQQGRHHSVFQRRDDHGKVRQAGARLL